MFEIGQKVRFNVSYKSSWRGYDLSGEYYVINISESYRWIFIGHKHDNDTGWPKHIFEAVPMIEYRWRTAAVMQLAETIYATKDHSLLPLLADALEEAGCDDESTLTHLRDLGDVHMRDSCFLVRDILHVEEFATKIATPSDHVQAGR